MGEAGHRPPRPGHEDRGAEPSGLHRSGQIAVPFGTCVRVRSHV